MRLNNSDIGLFAALAAGFVSLALHSCASIGTPSGGPRDEEPPRYVRSHPEPYATGFSGERVEIEFDELVNVKDAFTSVTLSPPQRSTPKVSASGRKVVVQFNDSLRPGTTYCIDFGKSIEDVNEGNRLPRFALSFSTGDVIDTLQMSGVVLDAMTLEPQQSVLVGAYANPADSTFLTLPFEHVTRTDDRGRFVLRGLRSIPYRVFALADLNNDYHWDNPAELMAFLPAAVTPWCEQTTATDTIYNTLTGLPDSTVTRPRTRYLPNDLFLPMFDMGYRPQYVVNSLRNDSTSLSVVFNQRQDTPTTLQWVGPRPASLPEPWYMLERNERNDSITYYLTPALYGTDTVRASVSYRRIERGHEPQTVTDTLTFITKRPRPVKNRRRSAAQMRDDSVKAAEMRFIRPVMPTGTTQEVYRGLVLDFPEPLVRLDTTAVRLEQMTTDSVWNPRPIAIVADTLMPRRLHINTTWDYGGSYRLSVDSLAAQGVSGRFSKPLVQPFKTKKREDYAALVLRLKPDTIAGFVEVLNTSDQVVQRATVTAGVATFSFLAPADYYVRFIADANGNGRFDPGDYDLRRQPEDTYYYPKMLSLKRYDRNEVWELNAVAVDMQKPDQIKKNKPEPVSRPGLKKKGEGGNNNGEEEDDYFDVNRNPFDPNDKGRRRQTAGSY